MMIFGVCFVLYLIKLSAGKGFKIQNYEHINIIAVYRSPQVPLGQRCSALQHIVDQASNNNIFIGDFNVNWLVEMERQSLYNDMVRDNGYRQLIENPTTDNNTVIDHIYTNIVNMETVSGNLETYFSDHKAIWIACKKHKYYDKP